jgi:hypothetical protein
MYQYSSSHQSQLNNPSTTLAQKYNIPTHSNLSQNMYPHMTSQSKYNTQTNMEKIEEQQENNRRMYPS